MINNGKLILTPTVVTTDDGQKETVYIAESVNNKKQNTKEGIVIIYFVLATIAVTLGTILSIRQLMKKG